VCESRPQNPCPPRQHLKQARELIFCFRLAERGADRNRALSLIYVAGLATWSAAPSASGRAPSQTCAESESTKVYSIFGVGAVTGARPEPRRSPANPLQPISRHFERDPHFVCVRLTGGLGRRDSNLCISESRFANPLKIRTNIAAIKRTFVALRRFRGCTGARTRFRDLSCSAVPQTSNNIRQK
jgi:hypothetical protein